MNARHRADRLLARVRRWMREQAEAPRDLTWITERRIEAHGDAGGEVKEMSRDYRHMRQRRDIPGQRNGDES